MKIYRITEMNRANPDVPLKRVVMRLPGETVARWYATAREFLSRNPWHFYAAEDPPR